MQELLLLHVWHEDIHTPQEPFAFRYYPGLQAHYPLLFIYLSYVQLVHAVGLFELLQVWQLMSQYIQSPLKSTYIPPGHTHYPYPLEYNGCNTLGSLQFVH